MPSVADVFHLGMEPACYILQCRLISCNDLVKVLVVIIVVSLQERTEKIGNARKNCCFLKIYSNVSATSQVKKLRIVTHVITLDKFLCRVSQMFAIWEWNRFVTVDNVRLTVGNDLVKVLVVVSL